MISMLKMTLAQQLAKTRLTILLPFLCWLCHQCLDLKNVKLQPLAARINSLTKINWPWRKHKRRVQPKHINYLG